MRETNEKAIINDMFNQLTWNKSIQGNNSIARQQGILDSLVSIISHFSTVSR